MSSGPPSTERATVAPVSGPEGSSFSGETPLVEGAHHSGITTLVLGITHGSGTRRSRAADGVDTGRLTHA